MTENTPYHWVQEVEPWRFKVGLECGTHWYDFWRRGSAYRTYSYQDDVSGAYLKGFAVGAVMVSWGKHPYSFLTQ